MCFTRDGNILKQYIYMQNQTSFMGNMGQNVKEEPNVPLSKVDSSSETEDDTKDVNNSKKKYKCTEPGCEYAFLRPSKLAAHMRNHTGERPYRCTYPNCNKTYTNSSHLKRHCITHDDIKQRYKCTKCSMLLSNQHNLRRHYERWHRDRKHLTCEKCNVSFANDRQFKEHTALHEGNALYTCKICQKQYNVYNRFRKHLRYHNGGPRKIYSCQATECSEIFEKRLLLRAHVESQHADDHKCQHCGKVFVNSSDLQEHAAIHSNTPIVYTCPYENCLRFYYFMRNLKQHIRIKHEEQFFLCDICGMKLCSRQKLIQHMNIHMSNKEKKSPPRGNDRKKRKDAGDPKRSALSILSGFNLPRAMEKNLLLRKPTRKVCDNQILSSSSSSVSKVNTL